MMVLAPCFTLTPSPCRSTLPALYLQIPPEYGGCSPFKLGYSPEECALQDLATSLGSTTLQTTTATANINNNNRNNNTGLSAHTRPPHTPSHLHFSAVTAHAEHSEDVADGRAGGGAPAEGGGGMREEEGGARDMPAGSATGVRDTDAEKGGVLDSGRGGLWGFRSRDSSSISSGGETGRPVIAARVSGRGGGGENGQGVKQRLASVVRRMGGGMRGGVRATEAYLGVENKFRYDSERRMWVMDGEDGEGRRGSGDGFAGGRWGANDGERDLEVSCVSSVVGWRTCDPARVRVEFNGKAECGSWNVEWARLFALGPSCIAAVL